MKLKSILLLVTLLTLSFLTSCTLKDDRGINYITVFTPIESVEMDSEFNFGQTHIITMTYEIPNSCYEFNNFAYTVNDNQRTIAIINTVYDRSCEEQTESVEVSLNFTVTVNETHIFKFWKGKDEEGEDVYQIIEVPVIE